MPPEQPKEAIVTKADPTSSPSAGEGTIDETVSAHMMRIMGAQQSYVPTQAQVDKILALQEKGMDYTHDERTRFAPKQKAEMVGLGCGMLALLFIFVLCVFFAKEYLGEVISGIVGLTAGGFGGYGFAKSKKAKTNDD